MNSLQGDDEVKRLIEGDFTHKRLAQRILDIELEADDQNTTSMRIVRDMELEIPAIWDVLNDVKDRVPSTEWNVQSIGSSISSLTSKLNSLDARTSTLENSVTLLKEELVLLDTAFAEYQVMIHDTLKKHEQSINCIADKTGHDECMLTREDDHGDS